VRTLVDSARLADWWPWLQRVTPPPAPGLLLLHAAAVAAACASVLAARPRKAAALVAACTCAAIAGGWWPAAPAAFAQAKHAVGAGARPVLGVTVLDVGQGDCVVVQFPSGSVMVVDAGGLAASPRFDIGRRVVSPALHALGARAVSWLVLTHGDPDHIGGAAALIDDWQPREVWEGVPVARHGPTLALRKLADRHGAAWRAVRAGDRVTIDGVEVRGWHPPPPDWERQRVRNDDSVVLELRFGEVSIVLPGDIGAAVEDRLAGDDWPRRLRVLKAAHHGSAGSSSARWLAALGPSAVVYSAGRGNPFGHPAVPALRRVEQAGAEAFRTDEDGAVHVATDGERVAIETMSGRRWMRKAR
jgi:competence protein ComEC